MLINSQSLIMLTQAVQVELEVGRGGATVRQRYTLR